MVSDIQGPSVMSTHQVNSVSGVFRILEISIQFWAIFTLFYLRWFDDYSSLFGGSLTLLFRYGSPGFALVCIIFVVLLFLIFRSLTVKDDSIKNIKIGAYVLLLILNALCCNIFLPWGCI